VVRPERRVRLASTPILTVERDSPVFETSARKVGVLTRSKACQIPPLAVRLANDDDTHSFTRSQVERLGRAKDAVFVERFNGSHDFSVAPSGSARESHAARTVRADICLPPAQRTWIQLRRPSEREVGVCCKPELGGAHAT
jgi:hypothetical protein